MSEFIAMFNPGFLLHHALWGSIAVGLFCPLIGGWFTVRRMVLLGVTLPQVSAAGIAFVFFLQGLGWHWSPHAGETGDRFLALAGSLLFVFATMAALASLERGSDGLKESRLGALYAAAYAAAILLVSANPNGKVELLGLLHGEVVSVTEQDLGLLLRAYAALGAAFIVLHRQFLLVAFDRDSATVMGKNVLFWDLFFYAAAGLALSMSVLIVGPMMTFAFLVIPPLTARPLCRGMGGFLLGSCAAGGLTAVAGFWLSYRWDWPLGPTNIMVAFAALLLVHAAVSLRGRVSASRARRART
ncbi:MAG: metal ABC transporter permease [Elusimicrobia bacterium]|nr:metal ABC transporter permease [Elusimicrobiota bacterium]